MKNKGNGIINQTIPNEFSSSLIKYKVEHNPNIHYNYNLAEITAMREERLREDKENKKRQQITECIKNCKQNISKYNQQNETNKINESISSIQRGKEYNENLRKQMKMKAEKKKKLNNKETEINIKNYEEEVLPTFSFKEQQDNTENIDLDGNLYSEFYNNNNSENNNTNNNIINNTNVIDVSKNIMEQIHENSEIYNMSGNKFISYNNISKNNIMNNNIINNQNNNSDNKNKNIRQEINNNIQLIQNFRKNVALNNNSENNIINENDLNNI